MEVEAVQAAAQEVAANQAAAAEELFTDVNALCEQAAAVLAELVKQGDEADRHKLRTAALKLRLGQLAKERRAREAAEAAAFQARQRELDRLLQEERALQPQVGAPLEDALHSAVLASPVSRTG
ncbi:hypothetical protein C2E21_1489 [Chlorella sorokiniana]|uniref:Uncharacterized protein n=1 Tax=Chlorella sorokiniana TaxID=3076 RepID=A0A2P6U0C8_CHLSO|nr:hypothetical protein C2E21_1489 [Chlorella sorokiniana]|eukprot:PRW59777.1 hypothetical protein C2E21_1489 [Chlorella sorokiniana]